MKKFIFRRREEKFEIDFENEIIKIDENQIKIDKNRNYRYIDLYQIDYEKFKYFQKSISNIDEIDEKIIYQKFDENQIKKREEERRYISKKDREIKIEFIIQDYLDDNDRKLYFELIEKSRKNYQKRLDEINRKKIEEKENKLKELMKEIEEMKSKLNKE